MLNSLKISKNLLFINLFILCIINIIQGYSTELLEDEAYYWVYSKFMNWGYFDHPPIIAIWIRISNFLFTDELGVRFFSAITLSITIYLIWLMIEHPKKKEFTWLFLLVVLSTVMFNAYGFITVPDTPLLFFMAIFLLFYKKYLGNASLLNYIILSISMAGLLYSKYQGVLIIGFVLLSNLKILKDYKIWLSALGTLFLFFPHLYWQYINNYLSFCYHLYERSSNSSYSFEYTLLHFVNLIAIIGLTFPIVYLAFFKNSKNKNIFQKALNFIVWGFAIFFFLMSFKGPVQAQWILPISIPLIIITFNYLIDYQKKIKLFTKLATTTIVILCFLRIVMAMEILPLQLEIHGNKRWVAKVKKEIGNKKPLFFNSYQNAAVYSFYSKDTAISYAYFKGRKNQYSLLQLSKLYDGKNVAHLYGKRDKFTKKGFKIRNKDSIFISYIPNFQDINYLSYHITDKNIQLKSNAKNQLNVVIENPYKKEIYPTSYSLFITIQNDKKKDFLKIPVKTIITNNSIKSKKSTIAKIEFQVPKMAKKSQKIKIQLIGKNSPKLYLKRISSTYFCTIK